jgi:hypothetical protein
MRNAVFCDVTPCGSCKSGLLEEHIPSIIRVTGILRSMFQLLVIANAVPSLLILSIPVMDKIRSYETLVLTRATQPHIPEDGILPRHRRENSK